MTVKKLIDYAKVLRSKNAGPLYVTFDLIFEDREKMRFVQEHLKKEQIARAYGVAEDKIRMIPYEVVNAVKITFPRKIISGGLRDNDIYGCQQHVPLANIELS
ncbi:MAG: DUF4387 domain-containing protein [Clostridia bacterium]|nr:DUF4387 domain-containing protein [Clostridia bacterium]